MNSVKVTKRGSAIVEGAITLPIFILCSVTLALIIVVVSTCENIGFVTAKEMRKVTLTAAVSEEAGILAPLSYPRSEVENGLVDDFKIRNFDYLFEDDDIGIYDLIALDVQANLKVTNPIGILGKVRFDDRVLARGFTGATRRANPLGEDEFSEKSGSKVVVIFPKYGIRYHTKDCRYVSQNYNGESYHIEIEAEDAKRKGYTPCKVCNGGEELEHSQKGY